MQAPVPGWPTASWIELAWTVLALVGLLLGLHRLAVRARQWREARAERHVPATERVITQANLRHQVIRALKLAIAVWIGAAALATPAGQPVGDAGALGLLGIVALLLVDLAWDEVDGRRLRRAIAREGGLTAWDGTERRESAH